MNPLIQTLMISLPFSAMAQDDRPQVMVLATFKA